jgi:uncharacterized protein YkwD
MAAAVGAPGDAVAKKKKCKHAGAAPGLVADVKLERALKCVINKERRKAGADKLKADSLLDSAAGLHSQDMVARDYFDHTSPEGSTPEDRAVAAGYRPNGNFVGEILALAGSPRQAVRLWLGSTQGHREAMLNDLSRVAGFGIAPGNVQPGAPDGPGIGAFTVMLDE